MAAFGAAVFCCIGGIILVFYNEKKINGIICGKQQQGLKKWCKNLEYTNMKIIQEENYEYAMRNEVEPYLAAHCRDKFVTGAKEDGQGKTTRAAKLHV